MWGRIDGDGPRERGAVGAGEAVRDLATGEDAREWPWDSGGRALSGGRGVGSHCVRMLTKLVVFAVLVVFG